MVDAGEDDAATLVMGAADSPPRDLGSSLVATASAGTSAAPTENRDLLDLLDGAPPAADGPVSSSELPERESGPVSTDGGASSHTAEGVPVPEEGSALSSTTTVAPSPGHGSAPSSTAPPARMPHPEATPAASSALAPADSSASAPMQEPAPRPALTRAPTEALDMDLDEPKCEAEAPSGADGIDAEPQVVLVSTNAATAPDIKVGSAPVSVGRDDTATVVLADPRVSGEQFVVRRVPVAGSGGYAFELEDKSKNGTLVSKKVVRCSSVRLQEQDLVEVLPAGKVGRNAAISFLFQSPHPPAGSDGTAADEPAAKRPRVEDKPAGDASRLFEGVTCSICQEVIHRAASVQPCLHSFCSACLGAWLQKPAGATCPLCRKAATGVARNTTVDGIIDGLLAAHPKMRRSSEVLAELDANDPLAKAEYDLGRLRGGRRAAPPPPVAFGPRFVFAAPGAFGFAAAAAAAAEAADADDDDDASQSHSGSAESEDEEEAPPPGPPCVHCMAPSWRQLGAAAATLATNAGYAAQLKRDAFARNDFEIGVLDEWLASRPARGTLAEAVAALLATPNPEGSVALRIQLARPAGPGASGLPAAGSWAESDACRSCVDCVLRAAIYGLRERIPEAELPARARGRSNCWYGRGCRTQSHRAAHAERLNHICEQTRGA